MKKLSVLLVFLLITGVLLGACTPKEEPAVVVVDEPEGPLTDLGGREVTIAVENA